VIARHSTIRPRNGPGSVKYDPDDVSTEDPLVENILNGLVQAVVEGNTENTVEFTKKALQAGIPPSEIFTKALSRGLEVVGEKFSKLELFLTDMMLSADAVKASMEILQTAMPPDKQGQAKLANLVIGTVNGDIHDIGKNLVSTMLSVAGFVVHDLGVDVPVKIFTATAQEKQANIMALSSLMTTTRPYQRKILTYLNDAGKRSDHFVVIGGGATNPEWAREIGADGYGRSAEHAVKVCKRLIERKIPPPLDLPVIIDS